MPFAIIVVEKGILIIFAALNLILEILVVDAVDKIFIRIEVKMLLIGNLSSRETEVRPCLVIKWARDGGFESCRAESKFITRIVLICKYKYEITIKVLLQLMAHKKATKLTSFYVQKKCSRLLIQSSFTFNQRTSVVGGGEFAYLWKKPGFATTRDLSCIPATVIQPRCCQLIWLSCWSLTQVRIRFHIHPYFLQIQLTKSYEPIKKIQCFQVQKNRDVHKFKLNIYHIHYWVFLAI